MLNFLKKRLKSKTIVLDGNTYLTRYYIFSNRWFGLFLHEFHRADGDRDLHNHPWLFSVSWVLKGYYVEERLSRNLSAVLRDTFRFNFIPGSCFHRIAVVSPNLHTLFFRGPRWKCWGFLRAKNDRITFVPHIDE